MLPFGSLFLFFGEKNWHKIFTHNLCRSRYEAPTPSLRGKDQVNNLRQQGQGLQQGLGTTEKAAWNAWVER